MKDLKGVLGPEMSTASFLPKATYKSPLVRMPFHFYGIMSKGSSSVTSCDIGHCILRVEDVNMGLWHLFADSCSCPFT